MSAFAGIEGSIAATNSRRRNEAATEERESFELERYFPIGTSGGAPGSVADAHKKTGKQANRVYVVRDRRIDPLEGLLVNGPRTVVTYGEFTLRQLLYKILDNPASCRAGIALTGLVLIFIIVSTVTFCVSSYARFQNENVLSLAILEGLCVGVFTAEFVTKCVCVQEPLKLLKSPLMWIDFLAIFPFYLELIFEVNVASLAVLRAIRLARIFRLFKLGKYSTGFSLVTTALVRSSDALALLIFLFGLAAMVYSSLLFYAEQSEGGYFDQATQMWIRKDGRESPFQSIPATCWWAIVTMTTVGYGDTVPITTLGKFVAGMTMVTGIVVIAFPITIIGANFSEAWKENEDLQKKLQKIPNSRLVDLTAKEMVALMRLESDVCEENLALIDSASRQLRDASLNVSLIVDALERIIDRQNYEELQRAAGKTGVSQTGESVRGANPP